MIHTETIFTYYNETKEKNQYFFKLFNSTRSALRCSCSLFVSFHSLTTRRLTSHFVSLGGSAVLASPRTHARTTFHLTYSLNYFLTHHITHHAHATHRHSRTHSHHIIHRLQSSQRSSSGDNTKYLL